LLAGFALADAFSEELLVCGAPPQTAPDPGSGSWKKPRLVGSCDL